MAEFVLRDMCSRAGLAAQFDIASAATSSEELGNPVYPPARRKLAEHGIGCEGKTARRIRSDDYDNYDLLIGMDDANMRNMARAFGGNPEGKLHLLLEYAGRPGDAVADPWYTRDFEATWRDINAGCLGLLNALHPQVTLDLSACRERRELYSVLRRAMLWQDWYGENLDANVYVYGVKEKKPEPAGDGQENENAPDEAREDEKEDEKNDEKKDGAPA